jgi:imidazolonepropionase-like amidohydrolase
MESYATAGVPNTEIVKAATVNGAKWLGKDAEFGTIEPGKRADLIIVDGDPLKDIKNTRKITTVIQDGRVVFSK